MKKYFIIFALMSLTQIALYSQVSKGLVFQPLLANIYESRIGTTFMDTEKKLRLDIGGNYDFYQSYAKDNFQYGFGAEFFTYTRLRSEGNFKFPVETTDFYFGINYSFNKRIDENKFEGRMRIAHISTHLSDGFSSNGVFFEIPYVYSKEFADIIVAYRKNDMLNINWRAYCGFIYIFSYLPKDINTFVPQFGIEAEKSLNNWLSFVLSYDFKLNGYDGKKLGMNNLVGGIRFKPMDYRSILLKFEYYNGENYYGQFYRYHTKYFGTGFQIEFN